MRAVPIFGAALLIAGCSGGETTGGEAADAPSGPIAVTEGSSASAPHLGTAAGVAPTASACTDYRADLEEGDMVRVYYGAAGLPPPIEKWAERVASRLDRNLLPEEAWKRATAEATAQWTALKDLRCVTLRTESNIARYDSARGGLIIDSFSPSSYYTFSDYGEQVRLKLRNADRAMVWRMTADRAQALLANSGLYGSTIVARLSIVTARPTQGGGVFEAEVDSFDVIPREHTRNSMATIAVNGA
jgi:phytoene dehydrogenase-like protein